MKHARPTVGLATTLAIVVLDQISSWCTGVATEALSHKSSQAFL